MADTDPTQAPPVAPSVAGYGIDDSEDVIMANTMGKGVNPDLIILIVILVVLIGGGVFFFVRSRRTHQEVPQQDPEQDPVVAEETVRDIEAEKEPVA